MMKLPQIPQDDLMDVMEMTRKIEIYISRILKNNDLTLAMSAMMNACTNCLIAQCKTLDEVMFYRNVFIQFLDISIRQIQIKEPENPN